MQLRLEGVHCGEAFHMPVIFFDIGATLADAFVEPNGSLTLQPRPRVMAVLDALREVRTGIISNPGPGEGAAARAAAALHKAFPGRFTDEALVHWGVKGSRRIFAQAVASTGGAAADDCVFVGEDVQERAFAREAGMRTAAHPVFAFAAMEERPVFRTQIELAESLGVAELATTVNKTEAVVVQIVSEQLVLAMVTTQGAEALEHAGFTVNLQGPVDGTAAFAIRDDQPVSAAESLADAPQEAPNGIEGRSSTGEGEQSDDAERRATEKFINDLLERGEAVFEGEDPTPSTTHVIKREDDGRLTARRLRFFH
ncbi:HAD family hydrolase [Streptomyces sannanensis]|uniref:HAD family hydrolase n=1 Tax=Streptomyces sannanensis TaxID=285536 RepID=UPI0031F11BD2